MLVTNTSLFHTIENTFGSYMLHKHCSGFMHGHNITMLNNFNFILTEASSKCATKLSSRSLLKIQLKLLSAGNWFYKVYSWSKMVIYGHYIVHDAFGGHYLTATVWLELIKLVWTGLSWITMLDHLKMKWPVLSSRVQGQLTLMSCSYSNEINKQLLKNGLIFYFIF